MNKYNISNRCENLGSKQCRYEIETTGKLPDESAIQEKERRHVGEPSEPTGARVFEALRRIGRGSVTIMKLGLLHKGWVT
jgi:hypothetical protein